MAVPNIYGAGMGGNPGDSPQISLVKIVAQLYELVVTQGGMSVPNLYGGGMWANPGDSPQISLVKIVALLNEYVTGGGSGAAGEFYTFGNGAPPTDGSVTTQGYWDLDTSTAWVNTNWDNTLAPTWVAH